jgi:hypothetical protein
VIIAAGAAIAAGAFLKPVRWLILPAVTLALAAGTVAAAGIDLDGGVGDREYRPGSSVDLRSHYELGIGELVIDLRDTDLPAGDVPLDVDVGIGQARVLVPDDMCVATDAEIGVGHVQVFGLDHGGVDVDFEAAPDARTASTRLLLSSEIGVGELRVTDSRGDFFFHDGDFDRFDEDADLTAAQPEACAA